MPLAARSRATRGCVPHVRGNFFYSAQVRRGLGLWPSGTCGGSDIDNLALRVLVYIACGMQLRVLYDNKKQITLHWYIGVWWAVPIEAPPVYVCMNGGCDSIAIGSTC